MAKYHYPIIIISAKSTLILTDLDTLSRVARDSRCAIGVTITTLDRKLAGFLEPWAPFPETRLNVIREIKQRWPEIQAGVNFIPIVPFLGDDKYGGCGGWRQDGGRGFLRLWRRNDLEG